MPCCHQYAAVLEKKGEGGIRRVISGICYEELRGCKGFTKLEEGFGLLNKSCSVVLLAS